jgi:hypothetical protein
LLRVLVIHTLREESGFGTLIRRPVLSFSSLTSERSLPPCPGYGDGSCCAQKKGVYMIAKFSLGQVVITANAQRTLHPADIPPALARHLSGDWGEVCEADRQENELSLAKGFRLLSVYRDRSNSKFWIITEADRSATTILLPEDY